jgi:predicted enzyme related to lactoylglutathione lyase
MLSEPHSAASRTVLERTRSFLIIAGSWFRRKAWSMQIQGIYASLATANMDRAETFYTRLFEREPDDRPMDGLIQWRNIAGANIQIFRDEKNAGSGRLTIVVPNMDMAKRSLEEIGVNLVGELEGDYGRITQIFDPDGNRITLAEPPSRPFAT